MLKTQLPDYISWRIQFIDPILETLILFQDQLFCKMYQSYQPMENYVNMALSVIEGYERRKDEGIRLLDNIPTLHNVITSPQVAGK